MNNKNIENKLKIENEINSKSQQIKRIVKFPHLTPTFKKVSGAKIISAVETQFYEQSGVFNDKILLARRAKSTQTVDEKKLRKVKELSVFTFSKQMTKYVFQCTQKSPKIYRWSVVSKMQAISLDFIEKLYIANVKTGAERLSLQYEADTQLKLLAFTAEIAKDMSVISAHQFKTLSKYLLDCKKTLWGWIKCKK